MMNPNEEFEMDVDSDDILAMDAYESDLEDRYVAGCARDDREAYWSPEEHRWVPWISPC